MYGLVDVVWVKIEYQWKEIMVGQDNWRPITFSIQRARVSEDVGISSLYGTDQISGTNLVFVVL